MLLVARNFTSPFVNASEVVIKKKNNNNTDRSGNNEQRKTIMAGERSILFGLSSLCSSPRTSTYLIDWIVTNGRFGRWEPRRKAFASSKLEAVEEETPTKPPTTIRDDGSSTSMTSYS